jgi:release factor glutamine methyltransferase
VNIAEALKSCSRELARSDVPNAQQDAFQLVTHVTGKDKTFLIAHPEFELSAEQEIKLSRLTLRRVAREPLQYIVGWQDFYRLRFEVTPDVLIPRPETEILVERAIKFLSDRPSPRFCEIGVGSGCISISVLHEVRTASAIACDVSERALAVARCNAERNDVANRIELIISDLFTSVPQEKFDAILSNPPYVPEVDFGALQPEVRGHEPTIALTSGPEGLDIIRRLVDEAPSHLKTGGILLFEMGFNQWSKISQMLVPSLWTNIEILPDLQGIPRILSAVKQ